MTSLVLQTLTPVTPGWVFVAKVIAGKGQFVCGSKKCDSGSGEHLGLVRRARARSTHLTLLAACLCGLDVQT